MNNSSYMLITNKLKMEQCKIPTITHGDQHIKDPRGSFSSTLINKGTVLPVELDNQMLTRTGFSCKRTGTFTIN